MKTWKKVLLIISAIAAAIGISCIVIGVALGGRFRDVQRLVLNNFYGIHGSWVSDWDDWDEDWADWSDWEDWKFWEHHAGDRASDGSDAQSRFAYSDVNDLEIETGYGQILIQSHDETDIKVEAENITPQKFSSRMDGDKLVIRDKTKKIDSLKGTVITVYLPKDAKFQDVELEIGAGSAEIEGLTAREIKCSVGAGQIDASNIDADEVELDCGAGRINAMLAGKQSDYRLKGECGLGQVQFGDSSFNALGKNISQGNGGRLVEADCGVGQIDIQFYGEA